ncbi:2,3-bisphosphoglycerate-independent phosphoglycerate mutase [Patescibacteria group bacterium]|nr:2,3-bisphosphoglycerate-independent phosphoglycerate mutase [Patescibacteria group bacterium]
MRPKPAILIILDGWGVAPPSETNAISQAKTPVMDKLITAYPSMTLHASGEKVGLVKGEPGNSGTGHLNIGAGRIVYQTLPRIDAAIKDKSFFKNPIFLGACDFVKKNKSKLHLMGLVSPGGIHSHQEHLYALLKLAKEQNIKDVFIHAFLDGEDTIYNSGRDYIAKLQEKTKELKIGKIATLCGRFYAMDRDNRWERTEKAYLAITKGKGSSAKTAAKAIDDSYKKSIFDEEFVPTAIESKGNPVARVEDNDAVIFFNFGEDRARQLARVFVQDDISGFKRGKKLNIYFAGMTEYESGLNMGIAFPQDVIEECLAKAISDGGLSQFHIAETEKYSHVTYFLNGKKEEPFAGEERAIVPSPNVSSYEKKPEMSARAITERVLKEIKAEKYDFIVLNFANADLVGHTGDIRATIRAVETLDKQIGAIAEQASLFGGIVFVAASQGNAEEMEEPRTGKTNKGHSANPVPFIIVSEKYEGRKMGLPEGVGADLSLVPPVGTLGDVAPTILHVLGIKQPKEMTGKSLI